MAINDKNSPLPLRAWGGGVNIHHAPIFSRLIKRRIGVLVIYSISYVLIRVLIDVVKLHDPVKH